MYVQFICKEPLLIFIILNWYKTILGFVVLYIHQHLRNHDKVKVYMLAEFTLRDAKGEHKNPVASLKLSV
jgi:hypothetical protein